MENTLMSLTDELSSNLKARPLPKNVEAEQGLLGGLLRSNEAYEGISEFLSPDHFSHPIHQKIYQAIGHLVSNGRLADPVTLQDYFSLETEIKSYLGTLLESVISTVAIPHYARIIYDLHLRRKLIGLSNEVCDQAFEVTLENSAQNLIEITEQNLFELATTGLQERQYIAFGQALKTSFEQAQEAYKRDSRIVGITSGLADMDAWLGGFYPSDLIILAGRPAMGKTALATNIAFNAAKAVGEGHGGAAVAFFSLEMSADQLATRILSQETGIESYRIRRGQLSREDFEKFGAAMRKLENLPLYIDDTPALSISALRTRARRLTRIKKVGMIVVDYLQLLHGSHLSSPEHRTQEISLISRGLKALAKELNVPVLALSQLSRAVEQRDDKRPQLADLRESGSIEQDADLVLFIFREEYYMMRKKSGQDMAQWEERMSQVHNRAEVIVAKHRHGPVGTVPLFFDSAHTKFGNLADHLTSPRT